MASALARTHNSNWAKSPIHTLAGHRMNSGARRFFHYGDRRLPSESHQGFAQAAVMNASQKGGTEIAKSRCTSSPVSHSLLLISLRHDFLTDSVPHARACSKLASIRSASVKYFSAFVRFRSSHKPGPDCRTPGQRRGASARSTRKVEWRRSLGSSPAIENRNHRPSLLLEKLKFLRCLPRRSDRQKRYGRKHTYEFPRS